MNIILLGAPGAGKGTQAVKIADEFKLTHISTGDIFRKNIKGKTPLGVEAKAFIDKGQLVPDSLTVDLVRARVAESDCKNGFMLDGFPRNVYQADELQKFAKIDKVVNIDVDLTKLMKRLTGRRVCSSCGASAHISFLKPDEKCSCGSAFYQRDDDNEETVNKRLNVYTDQTSPLINFYTDKGVLINVDGSRDIDLVFEEIKLKLTK